MITAILRIPVSEQRKDEVARLLRSLIEPTRVETGCISCHLYEELKAPFWLAWVEEWETRVDLDRHLRSPRFKKILAALDMAEAEPDVRFNTVAEISGMQLIEDVRRSSS